MHDAILGHAAPLPSIRWIPGGDFGTLATLRAMRRLAVRSASDPLIRRTVWGLMDSSDSTHSRALAIQRWLKRYWSYLPDPPHLELVRSPSYQMRQVEAMGQVEGDCDDAAVLAEAMARAARLKTRYVVIGFDGPYANFRHVYTEALTTQGPVAFDVTAPTHIASVPTRIWRWGA